MPDADDKASEGLERAGSDPYVLVEVLNVAGSRGTKLKAETSVLSDQANPVWTGEVLQLKLPLDIMLPLRIRVTLKDKDWSSLDDPIASSELDISTPTGLFGRGDLMLKGCSNEADAQRLLRGVSSRGLTVGEGEAGPSKGKQPARQTPRSTPKQYPDVETCFGWGFVEGKQGEEISHAAHASGGDHRNRTGVGHLPEGIQIRTCKRAVGTDIGADDRCDR